MSLSQATARGVFPAAGGKTEGAERSSSRLHKSTVWSLFMKIMHMTPCLKSPRNIEPAPIDGYFPESAGKKGAANMAKLKGKATANSSLSSGSLIVTDATAGLEAKELEDSRQSLDSVAQIDFDCERISLSNVIGKGAQGTVYKAEAYDRLIAVKIVKEGSRAYKEQSLPELELLHGVYHPNLVRIYGTHEVEIMSSSGGKKTGRSSNDWDIFGTGPCNLDSCHTMQKGATMQLWILMEYCNKGSLWNAVKNGDFHIQGIRSAPNFQKIIETGLEIASGMQHLHDIGIIHGDLKPENVLLMDSRKRPGKIWAKIGDFGQSRRAPSTETSAATYSWGAVDHMAPETLRDGKMHFATDVFSFAILMVELITACRPFRGMTAPVILVAIVEGMRPHLPEHCPPQLVELIKQCWDQNWRKRPSFANIVHELINILG